MGTTHKKKAARPVAGIEKGQRVKAMLAPVLLAVCLVTFAAKAVTSMTQESSTFDETHYFGLGKYLLENHRWDVPGSILHPPLSFYIHSIPLLFFPTDAAPWKNDPSRLKDPEYLGFADLARGQALLSSPANQGDRLLNLSRFMMVLTAVLLGWFVYSWSYSLYGKWSAISAALLYSFCPNILAHARLITPDIAVTTFSFMTMYYFWRLLKGEHIGQAIVGGLCLGLAFLSKFTGALLIPIGVALAGLWWLRHKNLPVRLCCIFAAIGIAILFLGYGLNLEPYFAGIAYQWTNASRGHWSFLGGEYSKTGWWNYYAVAFLIKTPVVTLILLAISLVLFFRKKALRLDEAFLVVSAAGIFGFFTIYHQSIGLRYVLPIYPFLFVFASKSAPTLLSTKFRACIYGVLIAWYVGTSCYIHPHYLAYFNEFVGGPNNGYKYLVDSNLDWGQDLKGLKRFMEEHSISRINLSYFGSDSPARYGISYDWLPSVGLQNPTPEKRVISPRGWIAISATNLQGVYFDNHNVFAHLKALEPIARIGYSIFVYRLDD